MATETDEFLAGLKRMNAASDVIGEAVAGLLALGYSVDEVAALLSEEVASLCRRKSEHLKGKERPS